MTQAHRQKQFWKWIFQQMEKHQLYLIKTELQIKVNGIRSINSAQDISKGNRSILVNAFISPQNLKKIINGIQTKKIVFIQNEEELKDFIFEFSNIIESIKKRSDLLMTLMFLVQEKHEELAFEVYEHFLNRLDELSIVLEEESKEEKIMSKKEEKKPVIDEKRIKKLENDLLKAIDDLKKKTDELKDVKGLLKDEKKQATQLLNETKKEHQKTLTDTKLIYEEKLKTAATKINELVHKKKELEEYNKELIKVNNNLNNEIKQLHQSNKDYEEIIELYEEEEKKVTNDVMTISIIGKMPMGGIRVNNKSVRFEVFENIEYVSHELPKNDKCWVLRYDLNHRERDDLLNNEYFIQLDNIDYFDDYLKFSNALKEIDREEVRV